MAYTRLVLYRYDPTPTYPNPEHMDHGALLERVCLSSSEEESALLRAPRPMTSKETVGTRMKATPTAQACKP